ncbi:hypothetical protein D3C77_371640 [compost metagenome]
MKMLTQSQASECAIKYDSNQALTPERISLLSVHDWIQTVCAVIGVILGLYALAPKRGAQLREGIRAVSSTLVIIAFYLILILMIGVYGKEIVLFARSQAPIARYEVINLILNVLMIGGLVWACFFLRANLGKGKKSGH